MKILMRSCGVLVCLSVICLALSSAQGVVAPQAGSSANFYDGKTIRLIIGLPPGGGYDAYGRLVAAFLGRHIPGAPVVSPENMPGAGGIRAAQYVFRSAPSDGTVVAILPSTTLLEPLFNPSEAATFDARRFRWLGSASQEIHFCGVAHAPGVSSFRQWLNAGTQLTFGASGPAAVTYQIPMVLKNVLGAHLRVIPGYRGTPDIALAVERGEVNGICVADSSLSSQFKPLLRSRTFKLLIQMGPRVSKDFGDVPSVFDFAKNPEQKDILHIAFDSGALGRPFVAPPATPAAKVAILAKALAESLQDPRLLKQAAKEHLKIDYVSGGAAQSLVQKFYGYPPALLAKAKAALGQH